MLEKDFDGLKARIDVKSLSEEELMILWHLSVAYSAFVRLPDTTDSERREFTQGVHTLENLVLSRVVSFLSIERQLP